MQLFIALTFDEQDLAYQKINNFRQQFDHKYSRTPFVLMSLFSPFSFVKKPLSRLDYHKLVECLKDDLDNYLSGIENDFKVIFRGFDFAAGKKGVVYLKPELPDELFFFQEAALDYLLEHGASFSRAEKGMKSKDFAKTFLPIGRGDDQQLLRRAVEKAKDEFTKPFSLRMREVVLFEKLPGQWTKRCTLHRFHNTVDTFDAYDLLKEESFDDVSTRKPNQYRI